MSVPIARVCYIYSQSISLLAEPICQIHGCSKKVIYFSHSNFIYLLELLISHYYIFQYIYCKTSQLDNYLPIITFHINSLSLRKHYLAVKT